MVIILVLLLSLIFSSPSPSFASIIMRDNFDNCTVGCTVGGTEPNSPSTGSWMQWYTDNISATYGGVTHYSGEITSTGRGGSGKSLKLWRAGSYFVGSASYSGALGLTSPSSYTDFYFRFYAKIPSAMSIPDDTKAWRLNCSGGTGEIYFAFMGGGASPYFVVSADTGGGIYHTEVLATSGQLSTLRDGNWHCWQFRFNIATGTITFWADGAELSSVSHSSYAQTSWNSYFQHWPMGNSQGGDWQASWQSFEVDDFIMATTKAETDPDGADTTPPEVSSANIGSDGQTVTVNFNETVITIGYDNGDFNLDCSTAGNNISLNSISGSGTSRTFTSASTINSGDTCNLDYVGTTDEIEDSAGNDLGGTLSDISVTNNSTQGSSANLLLTETFNDSSMPNQNDTWGIWNSSIFDTSTKYSGASSVRFAWAALAEQPTGVNNAVRWAFTSTDTLYMSTYWRFDSTWRGSGFGFHPHIIYILPTVDTNLSGGTLRVYIETTDSGSNYAIPRMIIARGESADWYTADSSCNMSSDTWHKVECYLVNNTVGSANGVLQMWIDDVQVLNVSNATFRTSSSIHFAAVAVGPWMSNGGQGPNLSQTMWMDEMLFYDGIPSTAPTSQGISGVSGLTVR